MADSARWCDTCQAHGDHHTDRHQDAPLGLAKAACEVHGSHRPPIERAGGVFTVEAHHIHPKEFGGPDDRDNMVWVCPTGHSAIHELLRLLVKGQMTDEIESHYSRGERKYAHDGYHRIKAAGRLPDVRRKMGLPEQD